MPKLTPEELMHFWRQAFPDDASLWDAGWAFQAGDYRRALELAERAVAIAESAGGSSLNEVATPFIEACRAKLAGRRPAGEVPDTCALYQAKVEIGTPLDVPFIFVCDSCVPKVHAHVEYLRHAGQLGSTRFPPKAPVASLCSFCGIGASVCVTLSSSGVEGMCYDCLEDFSDVVGAAGTDEA